MGATSGASILTAPHLLTSSSVWYVSSTIGVDAGGTRGKDSVRPLATTAQAMTNSATGDWIVYLPNHAETFTAVVSVTGARIFASAGTGSARARISRGTNVALFTFAADGCQLNNIYFPQSLAAAATTRVNLGSSDSVINNCYFECGANDTGAAMDFNSGTNIRIVDTTFISTATLLTAQPSLAIQNSGANSNVVMDRVTFDGGTVGWSNQSAFSLSNVITRLSATDIDLLRDSDMTLTGATTGFIQIRNKSGSSRIVWP